MKKSTFIFSTIILLGSLTPTTAQEMLPNQISSKEIIQLKLSGINYQEIKRRDSPTKLYKSTSFFINKNCLLTSAHNLSTLKGLEVMKITLYPARNGKKIPNQSITFNVSNQNYYKTINRNFFKFRWRKRPHDFALIYIPDSIINKYPNLEKIDHLSLLPSSDKIHKGDTIYCAGYPATDKYVNKNVMTVTKSTIKGVYKHHFSHDLETYRGNSGSPIMVKRNGMFYVIGVNSIMKNGTWINNKRQDLIQKWMAELKK